MDMKRLRCSGNATLNVIIATLLMPLARLKARTYYYVALLAHLMSRARDCKPCIRACDDRLQMRLTTKLTRPSVLRFGTRLDKAMTERTTPNPKHTKPQAVSRTQKLGPKPFFKSMMPILKDRRPFLADLCGVPSSSFPKALSVS